MSPDACNLSPHQQETSKINNRVFSTLTSSHLLMKPWTYSLSWELNVNNAQYFLVNSILVWTFITYCDDITLSLASSSSCYGRCIHTLSVCSVSFFFPEEDTFSQIEKRWNSSLAQTNMASNLVKGWWQLAALLLYDSMQTLFMRYSNFIWHNAKWQGEVSAKIFPHDKVINQYKC